jgi:hypothetical protein
MPGCFSRSLKWAVGIVAASLAGCSIHPIPDDVSRYSTAEIVRNVRCEAKDAVRDKIVEGLHKYGIFDVQNPDHVLKDKALFERIRRRAPILAAKFRAYGVSTITYDFDFNIEEKNNNSGGVTFTMPFVGAGKLTVPVDGQFDKTRLGKRTFRTAESFADLADLDCNNWVQSERNIAYPLTGSIGIGKIITTFLNISELGKRGAAPKGTNKEEEKVFKDEITFTTEISNASITPTLTLDAVPHNFRVTHATATSGVSRKDTHKLVVTLLFPDLQEVHEAVGRGAMLELSKSNEIKALENSCVAVERAREDRFRMLRRRPPAIYCREGNTE